MDALQQDIQGFPFYSLQECTHQQLLSHSKYPVHIYHRRQSNDIFVVKEIPFQMNQIKIYRLLKNLETLNIVPIYALTKLTLKKQKEKQSKQDSKKIMLETHQQNNRSEFQNAHQINNSYLLIWMQKCQKNLVDYVQERRKKLSPFTANQIKSFLFQILVTLRILQNHGICHRDIKPQNILINQGRYFLCDFDEVIMTKKKNQEKPPSQIMRQLQYTTILYSTPKFLKSIKDKNLKQKFFDPYKMDVYSLGLTLLYICSLGKFSIDDRHIYLYDQSGTHAQFIEEERRKYVKKDSELSVFNSVLKLMLQQDEYKRDDFQTLNQKIMNILGLDNQSEQSYETKSVQIKRKNQQKARKGHGKGFIVGKLKVSEKFILSVFLLTLLIYFFLLIF